MKSSRKLFSVLLSLLILMMALPVVVFAEEPCSHENAQWYVTYEIPVLKTARKDVVV